MTILLSSHQLPQEAWPDRYLIMEQGELISQGTPDELRASLGLGNDAPLTLDSMLRAALRRRKPPRKADDAAATD